MSLVIAVVVAAVAGIHIATWGMYKDAPHEGYTHRKYLRAIVLAAILGFFSALLLRLNLMRIGNIMVFFGCIYAAERGLEELYKTFLREEDQAKYFIPMQFHIMGRIVHSRMARWSVAAAWFLLAVLVGLMLLRIDAISGFAGRLRVFPMLGGGYDIPATYARHAGQVIVVLVFGGIGGWMSALGGAWKDAPIEGFSILKFFRSPLIASFHAFLLAHLTHSLVLITLGAVGYTVAAIETYKTFFFPNKPRGKFAGKPVLYPDMLIRRQRFIPVYAIIWILMIAGFAVALAGPHQGRL